MNRADQQPDARPGLLHVCGRFLPLSETFTYDLIDGLAGFRHHVVASTREHEDVFPWSAVHVEAAELDVWPAIAHAGIDGVLCHFGPQCTRGVALAAMLRVPVATIFHGYDISRLLQDRRWVERYRAAFDAGMRALCISEAGCRKLLAIGCPPSQVDVVRLGVDTRRFRFVPPSVRWGTDRPVRLLTVARLVPKKGIHVAVEAAARLRTEGRLFEWRVLGDGPEADALRAQAERLGVTELRWDGGVPRLEVERALAWADLYVQPSVTAVSGDEEGIPVSLMEAMAAGVPVVSTRHSGIPELVDDKRTGVLTDEHDAQGLADAITTLLDAPDRAEQLTRAGRTWVEQEFDQRRQLARTAAWLEQTLLPQAASASATRTRSGVVVQTIDPGLLARKLLLLAHRHPDLRFDVLATDPSAAALERLPWVGAVLPLVRDGCAAGPVCGPEPAVAIVPFSDETGAAEQWALPIAAATGAARVVGLTLHDRQVTFDEVSS